MGRGTGKDVARADFKDRGQSERTKRKTAGALHPISVWGRHLALAALLVCALWARRSLWEALLSDRGLFQDPGDSGSCPSRGTASAIAAEVTGERVSGDQWH